MPMPTRRSDHATRPSASMSRLPPGILNRTLIFTPVSSGLVVLIAIPPRLRFNVSAAAIVLPNRYWIGMPSTTRGLPRRLKLSGNRCGASDGRMCCTALYSLTYPATPRAASSFTSSALAIVPLNTRIGSLPSSMRRIDFTSSTPGAFGRRRSSTTRSSVAKSARTRASSSAALFTVTTLCPAPSSVVRKRSRTNAVSSATTTVLVVTEVLAISMVMIIWNATVNSSGDVMATCPECDAEIEVDEFEVDKGDQLSSPECGSNLEVTSLSPIELDIAPDEDEEEEEEDDDLDDADDDDDDLDDDDEDSETDDDGGWDE